MRLLAAACLILAAGCGTKEKAETVPKPPDPGPPLDFNLLQAYSDLFEQYIEILCLLDGADPAAWDDGARRLRELRGFHVFKDDPGLIRGFLAGGEKERLELGRRGRMLRAVSVFSRKYDKMKWDGARQELLKAGPGGPSLLASTLLKLLLNGQYRHVWPHLRYQLAEGGDEALKQATFLARELAQRTPSTAIFRHEDLLQVLVALIGFGTKGRSVLEELSRHREPNVRRTVAQAVGEAFDIPSLDLLERLASEDGSWGVRWAAVEALGRMGPARARVGPVLMARVKEEKDAAVRRRAIESIGEIDYVEALPELIYMLRYKVSGDKDGEKLAESLMVALYGLTGERLTLRPQWLRWYSEKYPAWKKRREERGRKEP